MLRKLELRRHLSVVHSADDDAFGKPHPAPYLTVSTLLCVPPPQCLVFEDSVSGAVAAKAARMKVIAVPDPAHPKPTAFDFCDARLGSLAELTVDVLERVSGLSRSAPA